MICVHIINKATHGIVDGLRPSCCCHCELNNFVLRHDILCRRTQCVVPPYRVLSFLQVQQGKCADSEKKACEPPVWILAHGAAADEDSYLEPVTRTHESTNAQYAEEWKTKENIQINK